MWGLLVLCTVLPDADVLGFKMGIAYGDLWGHRGLTHSLLFAGLLAISLLPLTPKLFRQELGFGRVALVLFLAATSHGVLDGMTDGGLGVAFFAPFDTTRYFLPIRPLHVSPIGLAPFLSSRGLHVLQSEVVWVWMPALLIGLAGHHWRRFRGGRGR